MADAVDARHTNTHIHTHSHIHNYSPPPPCPRRMEIDLRIGAAFTRFQTLRLQARFPQLGMSVISYGSCQFPTLGFVGRNCVMCITDCIVCVTMCVCIWCNGIMYVTVLCFV